MKKETKETIKDTVETVDSLLSFLTIIVVVVVILGMFLFGFLMFKVLQTWDPGIMVIKNTFN